MTIEQIIELLTKHIDIQSAEYSLAVSSIDIPAALAVEASLIRSKHTLALLQTLIGK